MALQSVSLKKAYSSDQDDILHEFYIPALEQSCDYRRLAGFFSSTSLAVAARGILGLVGNGGTMKLVVAPKLSRDDLKALQDSNQQPGETVERRLLEELSNMEDEFVRDHVFALGWMLANGMLTIKVAIARGEEGSYLSLEDTHASGLFHQKVGVLGDGKGSIVTFSGSVNETASGWLGNIEEFKVFRSWEPAERDYVLADVAKFERFWKDQSPRAKVVDIPHAVEQRLIEIAPNDLESVDLQRWYTTRSTKRMVTLFPHQTDAVERWLENGMKGIFEMATGTGKTFAALGCVRSMPRSLGKRLIVVCCPYQHLVKQWEGEIDRFGISYDKVVVADSSNPGWRRELADSMIDLSLGNKDQVFVITTHATFSSKAFMQILDRNKERTSIVLVADEVHGLGAERRRRGLAPFYGPRLGLSATPRRWFDEAGTRKLYEFFDRVVYEFPLARAINTINPCTGDTYLAPFRYEPRFAALSLEELDDYVEKSGKIARLWDGSECDAERARYLELMLFERANIVKNAESKLGVLDAVLLEIGAGLEWTIIYCSPQQIEAVMASLSHRGIVAHRFTMQEGTSPSKEFGGLSEREYLLERFAAGDYSVLVAMRCLDEGVDIPPARTAILMASSGNAREYVQRIGRVIRRFPGKQEATIYDIIVFPPAERVPKQMLKAEKSILDRELRRYEDIASTAINNAKALAAIYGARNRALGEM